MSDDLDPGPLNPDDYNLEVIRYTKPAATKGRVADRALERIGEDDAWSKSTLRKVAVVSRWRRIRAFLLRMLPSSVRTRFEPKPLLDD